MCVQHNEIKHVSFNAKVYFMDPWIFFADIHMLNPSVEETWFEWKKFEVLPLDSVYVYTEISCKSKQLDGDTAAQTRPNYEWLIVYSTSICYTLSCL